jgi:hypothetical protein
VVGPYYKAKDDFQLSHPSTGIKELWLSERLGLLEKLGGRAP